MLSAGFAFAVGVADLCSTRNFTIVLACVFLRYPLSSTSISTQLKQANLWNVDHLEAVVVGDELRSLSKIDDRFDVNQLAAHFTFDTLDCGLVLL